MGLELEITLSPEGSDVECVKMAGKLGRRLENICQIYIAVKLYDNYVLKLIYC